MNREIICPQCGLPDQVEKVSTIYLMGIGLNRQLNEADQSSKEIPFKLSQLTKADLHRLSRRLKPPTSGKQAFSRPVHPDLYLYIFGLIIPFFLYGILTSQRAVFWPVVGFLLLLVGLYAWQRKAIVARFKRQQAERQVANERIESTVQNWMALYYCARDDGVFQPGESELTPVEQMTEYLGSQVTRQNVMG